MKFLNYRLDGESLPQFRERIMEYFEKNDIDSTDIRFNRATCEANSEYEAHLDRLVHQCYLIAERRRKVEKMNGKNELTFLKFASVNSRRCLEVWPQCENWIAEQWTNAIAGEVGELCKKEV